MQIEIIIQALRERCPTFAGRVAGAAQYKTLAEAQALAVPSAFVIPLDDDPQESRAANSVRQTLTDSFAVVVYVSNLVDEKGQAGAQSIHLLRAELWAALLGWRPDLRYNGITYEGGSLLALDRARMVCQFEFGAQMEIEPGDGWQETELGQLPHFDSLKIDMDVIDPAADPNLQYPGPDGRIEVSAILPKTGVLP